MSATNYAEFLGCNKVVPSGTEPPSGIKGDSKEVIPSGTEQPSGNERHSKEVLPSGTEPPSGEERVKEMISIQPTVGILF